MAKENVMRFEEMTMKDELLQSKLLEASKAYAGDRTDEKALFEAVVAPLAREAGLPFTFEEAAEVKNEAVEGEVTLKDMKSVAGGFTGWFSFWRLIQNGGKQ